MSQVNQEIAFGGEHIEKPGGSPKALYETYSNKLHCRGNTTLFSEDLLDVGLWCPLLFS